MLELSKIDHTLNIAFKIFVTHILFKLKLSLSILNPHDEKITYLLDYLSPNDINTIVHNMEKISSVGSFRNSSNFISLLPSKIKKLLQPSRL